MRTPKNINEAYLATGILCTEGEVTKRIRYLMAQIEQNNFNGHITCKENRQMSHEIRQLRRYRHWLKGILKEVQRHE